MNEEQLAAWLANAFRLIEAEFSINKASARGLLLSLTRIRRLVEELPDESLTRNLVWKELFPRVQQELQTYGDGYAADVVVGLQGETEPITGYARRQLELAGISKPVIPPGVTVASNVQRILSTTYVGENTLQSMFGRGNDGLSSYVRSQARHIDRIVTEGILKGQTTEEIADRIVQQRAQSVGLPPLVSLKADAARRIQAEAKSLARTAVQSHNTNIHEVVYQANEEALSDLKWEWVAALDSRTCPSCAPLDGQQKDKRSDFPPTPLHPNCRCQVVAVDPEDEAPIRGAQLINDEEFRYNGKPLSELTGAEREAALTNGGLYASKVKVKGEKFYRKAADTTASSYAGWLSTLAKGKQAGMNKTLEQVFGGGDIGVARADFYRRRLKKRNGNADLALQDMLKVSDKTKQKAFAKRSMNREDAAILQWKGREELN